MKDLSEVTSLLYTNCRHVQYICEIIKCCTSTLLLSHHFATDEYRGSRRVYILFHEGLLLGAVRLGEEILHLHPGQLILLVAKEFTGHFVSHENPRALSVNRNDGLVGIARCSGE